MLMEVTVSTNRVGSQVWGLLENEELVSRGVQEHLLLLRDPQLMVSLVPQEHLLHLSQVSVICRKMTAGYLYLTRRKHWSQNYIARIPLMLIALKDTQLIISQLCVNQRINTNNRKWKAFHCWSPLKFELRPFKLETLNNSLNRNWKFWPKLYCFCWVYV